MLDDWTDGVGTVPEQILEDLDRRAAWAPWAMGRDGRHGSMPGRRRRAAVLLGGDGGDVTYPYYVVNGRIPAAPTTFTAKPGQRIRIRFINAGADTAFRVALAAHR